ncbi:MAG: hypothetical protein SXV54_20290 [Chloroflexota bacterium]|nr:hypothetical protein [Chloroflexota bacterium]
MIEHKDGIVLMDLVELEHCGFDVSEFHFELQAAGVDDPAAVWPVALLVNFTGGAMMGPCTSDEAVVWITEANNRHRFHAFGTDQDEQLYVCCQRFSNGCTFSTRTPPVISGHRLALTKRRSAEQ